MQERNNAAIERMLESGDMGVSDVPVTESSVLARIYRKFLLIGGMTSMRWVQYMNDYVKRIENENRGIRPALVSEKGNTTKVLAKDEFTWKNFIKAMKFLQTKRLRIIVERTDFAGKTHVVEEVIEFRTPPSYTQADEMDKESEE